MPPKGRPPVQHIKHVHVLSLSPELEEKIDNLQETFIKGKALRAAGEAAKGVLSHPAGFLTVSGIALGLFLAFRPGAGGVEVGEDGIIKKVDRTLFMQYARNILGVPLTALGIDQEKADFAFGQLYDIWREKVGKPIVGFFQGLF